MASHLPRMSFEHRWPTWQAVLSEVRPTVFVSRGYAICAWSCLEQLAMRQLYRALSNIRGHDLGFSSRPGAAA